MPIDQTTTDTSGEYHFDGLPPGTYYIGASAGDSGYASRRVPVDSAGRPTKLHDLPTYYPAALALSDAQGVRIVTGQSEHGIDIHLQRGLALSVKGKIAGAAQLGTSYSVRASMKDGVGSPSEAGAVLPNGDFILADLLPGNHRLTLYD